MSQTASNPHYLGQRLSFASALCTVHYIGPVTDTSGTWLGVEWDDAALGKHAGEHNGVQYFKCLAPGATTASFIRPSRPADKAISFLEALKAKYAPPTPTSTSDSSSIPGASTEGHEVWISGKRVEEVGFDKVRAQQAALQELRVVVLDSACIAGVGSAPGTENKDGGDFGGPEWWEGVDEVRETCQSVRELDLSRNLIERWADVVGICSALGELRRLVLSGNRFRDLVEDARATAQADAFTNVEELTLDSTYLAWEEICAILSHFPSLCTLSLAKSNLVTRIPPLPCPTLETLSLASNPLPDLSLLDSLTTLPALSSLNIRSCTLTALPLLAPPLKDIAHLDISSNEIPTLDALSTLPSSFPALSSLRVSPNPFFSALRPDEAHMLTLARLPGLVVLNFSKITPKERENAELYYLSRIRNELESLNPNQTQDQILSQNPQWKSLCEKHGQEILPEPAAGNDPKSETNELDPGSLAARLVHIQLKLSPAEGVSLPPLPKGEEQLTIIVPKTVNVYRLKALIALQLRVRPSHFRLVWETGELDPVSKYLFGLGVPGAWQAIWEAESDSEDEDDDEGETREESGERMGDAGLGDEGFDPAKWTRREVQLVESTRPLGYWVDGREAVVRVEILR